MRKFICIGGVGLLVLSGCGSSRPIKYYALQMPGTPSPASSAAYPVNLIVKRLTGPPLLESAPIVYRTGPNQLGVYTYHRWEEAPVSLVQTRLVRMLRSTGQYETVSDSVSAAGAEFVLRGRLYEFGEVSGSSLAGQVTMDFELYERKTGKVLWTHYYSQTEPADGREVNSVVQAIDRNLERGLKEVVDGLSQHFAANPPKKA